MRTVVSLFVVLQVLLLGSILYAYPDDIDYEWDKANLRHAHEHFDTGDYKEAYSILKSLMFCAKNKRIRFDAAYFKGLCCIKLQDWDQATNDFDEYLSEFDNGSTIDAEPSWVHVPDTKYFPETLYYLGLASEHIGKINDAVYYYKYCIKRYQGRSPFADTFSRERLAVLEAKDREKAARIMNFVEAVDTLVGVEEAYQGLSSEERTGAEIRKAISQARQKITFRTVHESPTDR